MENKETENVASAEKGVIDYTDQLKIEMPTQDGVNNKRCLLSGNVVTVNFDGRMMIRPDGRDRVIAILPDDLVPSVKYSFLAYNEEYKAIICYIRGNQIIAGHHPLEENLGHYYFNVTYVKG